MKTARVIITYDCNRNCIGCCNKNWKHDKPIHLFSTEQLKKFDQLIITGGEPLLNPKRLHELLRAFHLFPSGTYGFIDNIVLYTADSLNLLHIFDDIAPYFSGLTLTLHEQEDVESFYILNDFLSQKVTNISFRLNIFSNIVFTSPIDLSIWKIKYIDWIKDCPLLNNETLFYYAQN